MFVVRVGVVCCQVEISATSWSLVQEESYRLWLVVVCDQEITCDEEVMKKRADPLSNACSKNQLSNLGQSKMTC
jgi:NADPH-dependent 7-cyano-7-deazaguanine reductase QueF-like protein